MKCGSKGMKKGGAVKANMVSPRKAAAMGMKCGGKVTKMRSGGKVSGKGC